MKKIIAGNWKMNGDLTILMEMYNALENVQTENTIIICPPTTMLFVSCPKNVSIGAQDCSAHKSGAYTGEVSAAMIADMGAKYVIVGHSERRQYHFETNEIVREKAMRAIEAGLIPIICVGETLQDKEAGRTLEVIEKQVKESIPDKDFIIAYEPVWAIGTGRVATADDIAPVHRHIAAMSPMPILYGGSVKGSNAAEIMSIPNVGGVLVGGASLKPDDFLPIIKGIN
jgi:triosephosphate isomerase